MDRTGELVGSSSIGRCDETQEEMAGGEHKEEKDHHRNYTLGARADRHIKGAQKRPVGSKAP